MPTPCVSELMSATIHTIGRDQTLTTAHRMMRDHQIRHLPVLDGGRLVGILSQRDLYLIETIKDIDPDHIRVEEAMSQDVVTVSPEATLDEVAEIMIQHKLGSVVVGHGDRVQGIFTTTDALGALVASYVGAGRKIPARPSGRECCGCCCLTPE